MEVRPRSSNKPQLTKSDQEKDLKNDSETKDNISEGKNKTEEETVPSFKSYLLQGLKLDPYNHSGQSFNINLMRPVLTSTTAWVETLDKLEKDTEQIRKDSLDLQMRKNDVLKGLDQITQDAECLNPEEKEEIKLYADRLRSRLVTVSICVETPRSQSQVDSLKAVHKYIRQLVNAIEKDPDRGKKIWRMFVNSCSEHSVRGSIDERFQSAILTCTADDQKHIKKWLLDVEKKLTVIKVW